MNKDILAISTRSLTVLISLLCYAIVAQAARPTYSVPELTLNADPPGVDCTATPGNCFKIHYVTSTIDAPSTTDTDVNGIPDYIDSLRSVVIDVFNREIVTMGWTAPPSDIGAPRGGNGGDGRSDVYVRNFGCGGIANVTDEGAVTPGSRSWFSYVQFHKDVKACYDSPAINSGPGNISTLTQLQVIEDVFAHEFHHTIQIGINDFSSLNFKETTANWMNDEAYDDLNVNVLSRILGHFELFETPTTSLNSLSYGGWFWLRYISERFGANAVKDIWQQLGTVTNSEVTATSTVLTARGTTLKDAWIDFSGRLYAKQSFEEGSTYPDINPMGLANGTAPFNTYPVSSPAGTTINHLARKYYLFNPSSPAAIERSLRIAFNGPDGQDSGAVIVFQTADGPRIDRRITLDASNDGAAIVSGFSDSPPPAAAFARTTSAVLVMSNATQAADSLPFSFCSPNCALAAGADPMITPWGVDWGYREPLWQSIDVWVDNNGNCLPDAPGRPGCNEPDNPMTSAVDAEPTKGRMNTLNARIRNLGNVAVSGVTVRLQYNPFGVGVPGPFSAPIGSATIDLAAAGDPSGNDVRVVSVPWDLTDLTFNNGGMWDVPSTPAVETIRDFDHFCVLIVIEPPAGSDLNLTNNLAQNNFGEIPTDTTGGRTTSFLVGNPSQSMAEAQLVLYPPLPEGWTAKLSGVPLNRSFKLEPGQLELASVTFGRSSSAKDPEKDVVANVSLVINGTPVGGISVLLARAKVKGYTLGPADCLKDIAVQQDHLRQIIDKLSKASYELTFKELAGVEDGLRSQSNSLRSCEDYPQQQKGPRPEMQQGLKELSEHEGRLLEMFGKLLRSALPVISAPESEKLLEGFKGLLEKHPELQKQFDDLWRHDKRNSRLVLITPGPKLNYSQLDTVVTIYDHYFDYTSAGLQQNLIGEVRETDLNSLGTLPLTYRVLDINPSQSYYYWVYRYDNRGLSKLKARGANFLLTRSDKTALLVSLTVALNFKDYDSLHRVRINPLDLRKKIPTAWIAPETYQTLRDILGQPLSQRGGRDPTVNEMIRTLSTENCRTLLNQLTGHAPISVGATAVTIGSRFSSGSEIVTLMNWLVEELSRAGLDARLDTFFSAAHGRELQQVVATIPGTDLANQLILVTAHLDAVSGTEGADDNASGVVAMLCAARQLAGHRFRRTIHFVAFNAEEQGLRGSADYARRLIESGRWNICGAFNLDMVAFDQDNDRRIQLQTNGAPASNLMNTRIIQNITDYAINLFPVRVTDGEQSSDYAAFWRIGQPAINIGDEYFLCDSDCGPPPPRRAIRPPAGDFTPCYHLPCDNMGEPHLRVDVLMEVSKALIATVSDVALLRP